MKLAMAMLCSLFILALAAAQENAPSNPSAPSNLVLEVGQKAPAFSSIDQFGREQSNETLKGSQGTILLFFRSADW